MIRNIKYMCAVALFSAIGLSGPLAYAASPLTGIEGEITPDMRKLLLSVIGEVEDPPRSLAQARRRADVRHAVLSFNAAGINDGANVSFGEISS